MGVGATLVLLGLRKRSVPRAKAIAANRKRVKEEIAQIEKVDREIRKVERALGAKSEEAQRLREEFDKAKRELAEAVEGSKDLPPSRILEIYESHTY